LGNLRKFSIILILGFLFFSFNVAAAQSDGIRFGFKLTGGMNVLSVGDSNEYVEGQSRFWKTYTQLYGYSLEGEFKKIQMGLDFEGEMTIALSPQFGICLASGYMHGARGAGSSKIITDFPSEGSVYTYDQKVSAVPIQLGVYYCFPLTSRARLSLIAGAGYYLAKWSVVFHGEWQTDWITREERADGKGIGFHGGIGFEFDVAHHVALVLEGQGRFAKIGGFEGNCKKLRPLGEDQYNGKLYYYEELSTGTGQWYPYVGIWDEKPTWGRNVREASVDFSGFAIRAGVKINL
jgi:opacity protein-like surface antigen